MALNFIDKILHEAEDDYGKVTQEVKTQKVSEFVNSKDFLVAIVIFLVSLIIRVWVLFNVYDPQNVGDGWHGDVYHHWQIAYLTGHVGLHNGFLRLWDLKGMEFFWGPFHPLLLTFLFHLSGSTSIIIPRVVSIIFGSALLSLIYLAGKRYWGNWVGIAAATFGILNPVAIFEDASGMLEPIGYSILFLSIMIMDIYPTLSGIFLALALMVRAEVWFYSIFILVVAVKFLKKPGYLIKLFLGFSIPLVLYMKYLLGWTGNPVYPLWWNYLANALGAWAGAAGSTLSNYQIMIRPYLLGWFVISVACLLLVFFKKPKGWIILSLGFLVWAFFGGFFGATHYLAGFQYWFWYERFFVFPYYFLGLLISILFFYLIPHRLKYLNNYFYYGFCFLVIVIGGSYLLQGIWPGMLAEYNKTKVTWLDTQELARRTASLHTTGKILIPPDSPSFTYALVQFNGINASQIISEMFDPFYYMKGKPFDNWGVNRITFFSWLKDENITLIMVNLGDKSELYGGENRYIEAAIKEPQYIQKIPVEDQNYVFYKVNPAQIP